MKMIRKTLLLSMALMVSLPMSSASGNGLKPRVSFVNCDRGQTISKVIKLAERRVSNREHIIRISGVCNERINVLNDNITLDGQGSAVIDGDIGDQEDSQKEAVILIDGARQVTITGLLVKGASGNGILGKRGAVFSVRNTTVQDSAEDGLVATLNSNLTLIDSTVERSGDDGISVTQVSSVFFEGTIITTDNADDGMVIADSSTGDIRKAVINANNNGDAGIIAGDDAVIFTGAGDQIGTVFANNNGQDGILLFNAVTLEATGGGQISATGNGRTGIRLIGNSVIVSARGNSVFVLENNPVGIHLDVQSGVFIVGGLNVVGNEIGLLADGANTVSIISIPPNPSRIINNSEIDVDLRFGTRTTLNGVEVGEIVCDNTVLSRGSVVCPSQ